MELTEAQVADFLSGLKAELDLSEELTLETNLEAMGALDSLTVLGVISLIDEKFSKSLPSEDLSNIKTPADIIRKIEK